MAPGIAVVLTRAMMRRWLDLHHAALAPDLPSLYFIGRIRDWIRPARRPVQAVAGSPKDPTAVSSERPCLAVPLMVRTLMKAVSWSSRFPGQHGRLGRVRIVHPEISFVILRPERLGVWVWFDSRVVAA